MDRINRIFQDLQDHEFREVDGVSHPLQLSTPQTGKEILLILYQSCRSDELFEVPLDCIRASQNQRRESREFRGHDVSYYVIPWQDAGRGQD